MKTLVLTSIIILLVISGIQISYSVTDTDSDGIPDSTDKCPDLKEDNLGANRFDGCPVKEKVIPNPVAPILVSEPAKDEPILENTAPVLNDREPIETSSNEASDAKSEKPTEVFFNKISIPDLTTANAWKYLNKITQNISKTASLYDMIAFSIGMVVYGIFVYHFYRFISKKDLFNFNLEAKLANRVYGTSGKATSTIPRIAGFIATKLFVFPIVIFIWFIAYSLFLFFLAHDTEPNTIFLVSSSLLVAIRIAAYYSEDLAKDLAKLLPFSLLGIFLLNAIFFTIGDFTDKISQLPNFITQIMIFVIVSMIVEISLSVAYLIKLRFLGHKEKEEKISDHNSPV